MSLSDTVRGLTEEELREMTQKRTPKPVTLVVWPPSNDSGDDRTWSIPEWGGEW